MKIKIMTWNIGEDERNKNNIVTLDSYQYIKEVLQNEKIDIACFQEAITSSKDMTPISEYLIENTEYSYINNYELSESHINIGSRMGVVTCSKIPIKESDKLQYINPNLEYKKDENTFRTSHDKGFIITEVEGVDLVIANGHGLPFHAFKREAMDFKYIYENMENRLLEKISNYSNFIILGDMNYPKFDSIFPNITEKTNFGIKGYTSLRKNGSTQQLDYIMTSKNITITDSEILDCRFDHRIGIVEIEI